uniref:U-box domain containing 5 n=1 Tax=Xiphophorus couchianus TaxID=32473 RepID=A0A3B5LDE5_9TELE
MVVNLCLPHFSTTAHCNKLCADGYDVTNIVSADPSLRKQGFKLEYFLRPPLHVTLKFGFPVELSRVDVELWPWGMDRGQACKRLEISTSSDISALSCPGSESEFKQVARCELTEETQVSFSHSNFRPRAPFLSAPPPPPASSQQVKLWSRGLHSLSAVTQLRVTVPCGGAASSLGLKALAVWGQPARCCGWSALFFFLLLSSERNHLIAKQCLIYAGFLFGSASFSIPEEFLDPLTQEVMALPMLLPSGMSVDASTLEEYQKREATWGRPPNDPFTGVPFTSTCQPLPNPQLKSRIDHFLLQKGMVRRDGTLGGQDQGQNPQASRLVTSCVQGRSQTSPSFTKTSINSNSTHSTDKNTDTINLFFRLCCIFYPDGKVCSDCSRSVSVYSTSSSSSIYRLGCGHLLCRACVQKDSKSPNSTNKSGCIFCPTCLSRTPHNNILRVHY